jgi:hypothetical protein
LQNFVARQIRLSDPIFEARFRKLQPKLSFLLGIILQFLFVGSNANPFSVIKTNRRVLARLDLEDDDGFLICRWEQGVEDAILGLDTEEMDRLDQEVKRTGLTVDQIVLRNLFAFGEADAADWWKDPPSESQ